MTIDNGISISVKVVVFWARFKLLVFSEGQDVGRILDLFDTKGAAINGYGLIAGEPSRAADAGLG